MPPLTGQVIAGCRREELSVTADWRAIAEEIWPFVHGPASTPMGEAEAAWQARHQAMAA
jgi:hypothetical protein